MSGALYGLVVLDLTTMLAGPYCTQLLADLGARVIKIENPDGGDMTRHLPPHFVQGMSAYFLSVNRNKESVAIDLKTENGRSLFLGLVRKADVVVENFRPGVMERLRLGYEVLSKLNPHVVLCSISGYGQTGPYRDRPAYDMTVQAIAGTMSITGEPGRLPVRLGVPLGDLAAGLFGALGIQAALLRRTVDGLGQHVDVAMLDCQIALLSYLGQYFLVSGEVAGPQGRQHQSIPTYRSFTCSDGQEIVVTANSEKVWQVLAGAMGHSEWITRAEYQTNANRWMNREALWAEMEAGFQEQTAAEWLDDLNTAGVPAARVQNVGQALTDPQVVARQMVIELPEKYGEPLAVLGNPIKLSRTGSAAMTWPPQLGEQTAAVLREFLKLEDAALAVLQAERAIVCGGA